MTHPFWFWPDRVINKQESRILREQHNAAVTALKDQEDANRELTRALKSEQAMRVRGMRAQ